MYENDKITADVNWILFCCFIIDFHILHIECIWLCTFYLYLIKSINSKENVTNWEKKNETTFPCSDLFYTFLHKPKIPMVVLDIFTCLQRFTLAAGEKLECKGRANPYSLLLAVSLPLRFHKVQISLQNIQRA